MYQEQINFKEQDIRSFSHGIATFYNRQTKILIIQKIALLVYMVGLLGCSLVPRPSKIRNLEGLGTRLTRLMQLQ